MIDITNYPYNTLITDLEGIGLYRFRMEQLDKINIDSNIPFNDHLVGHLGKQYAIINLKTLDLLNSLITPVMQKFDETTGELEVLQKRVGYELPPPHLNSVWVNHQKKYEFNPIHVHLGVYTFVLWYDIPYTMEEEKNASPLKSSEVLNHSGQFAYIPSNTTHPICLPLPIDKTWNGTLAVFPANTPHLVYPFYSTDEERITISGNYDWSYASQSIETLYS